MIPEARRMYRFVDSIADNAVPAVVGECGVVKEKRHRNRIGSPSGKARLAA
jgi:hypothetical protein